MSQAVEVAVLGAAGTIAGAIVRDLAESDEVGGLRLLDLDADRAGEVAERHGAGKARAQAVDARQPGALATALEGCQVLVNSASYRINLEAMDAAVAAGCHYIDLGGLYWMTARQLERQRALRAGRPPGTAGHGLEPGQDERDGVWRRPVRWAASDWTRRTSAPRGATRRPRRTACCACPTRWPRCWTS